MKPYTRKLLFVIVGVAVFLSLFIYFILTSFFTHPVHPVPYETIEFETVQDSVSSGDSLGTISILEIPDSFYSVSNDSFTLQPGGLKKHYLPSKPNIKKQPNVLSRVPSKPLKESKLKNNTNSVGSTTVTVYKGRALRYQELPLHNLPNKRLQFSAFFRAFKSGDYIEGKELAAYYANDKTLNFITRKTVSNYVEKNIRRVTRKENSLLIETLSPIGISTKISIPLIEKMEIKISNGATINFGKTVQSKEILFKNALLLPIQTTGLQIISGGTAIPASGFVSGDFYFTEYAKTKGGYSLK
ncbi:MAG: hypothetical protein MUE33_01385 [Cytophagaceae bacterium]|jgi:hypothetical protein|nr:hypothetical protein [Cytophagaceae bacterium]